MIMGKSDFEDDWDTATKNMEEYKRDKQKWDNEKNKELRDLKTHASLLQNIQDNTDILCKLGAVIIVLLIIIAFQLFYQLLQLERYKGNDVAKKNWWNKMSKKQLLTAFFYDYAKETKGIIKRNM